jgi:DNA-binding NarL/FixJ family response regulator
MTFQIFIVEDHPVVRSAYALLLQYEPGLELCGTAASGEEAVRRIPLCQPDLVLVDLLLPGMHGLTLITHLYQMQPALPILIVSGHERPFDALRKLSVFRPSVKGYLHKQEAAQCLVTTIWNVLAT